MPVALKSSTPRSTEAGSVPVKYGFSVNRSTSRLARLSAAHSRAAQLNPHRLRVTARRTPTHPRIRSIWPKAPVRANTARHCGAAQCDPCPRLPPASQRNHGAPRTPRRSIPLAEVTTGKINGVLQSLLAPANRYWRSLHHFRRPLRRGHANMVDPSLIPAADQAEKVVRSGENHQ